MPMPQGSLNAALYEQGRLRNECDRLKALNAELVEALENLTVIWRQNDGGVVIGPVGWEQSRATLAKARE